MSSYFDEKQNEAAELVDRAKRWDTSGEADPTLCDDLRRLEQTVVYDCGACVEFPGCPDEVREAVSACIYKLSIEGQPANRLSSFYPSYDTATEHADAVARMIWDLHSIFHQLACVEGFSDHPHTPIRRLAAKNEERRERMVPPDQVDPLIAGMLGAGL